MERIGDYTVLTTSLNFMSPRQAFMKRMMDIAAELAGCIATGIIFLFIAQIIYISSPGPIFLYKNVSVKMEKYLKCINSAAYIWMQRKKKN